MFGCGRKSKPPQTRVPGRDVQALSSLGFDFEDPSVPIASGAYGHVYGGKCNEFAKRKRVPPDPTEETVKREREEVSLEGMPCAIKMCIDDPSGQSLTGTAFFTHLNADNLYAEAKRMEDLKHPNIAEVYLVFKSGPHRIGRKGTDLTDARIYFVMEYINGGTLRQRMSMSQPAFKEREALQIIRQLTEGLHYMHNSGVIHNDLHQGNIMFQRDDQTNYRVKIVDLGSTKSMFRNQPFTDIRMYAMHLIHILGKSIFTRSDVKKALRLFVDRINFKTPDENGNIIENMDDIWNGVIGIIGEKDEDIPEPEEGQAIPLVERKPRRQFRQLASSFVLEDK